MNLRIVFLITIVSSVLVLGGCTQPTSTGTNTNDKPAALKAGPLPNEGFKAEVTAAEPPAKLRAGQVDVINIKVKNTSTAIWWPAGGETTDRPDNTFYIAAGNRWLDKDGKRTSETEGHAGITKVIRPGESIDMQLQVTAPKTPGDWTMELDMVQEGVAWFSEKGSPTTKLKVTVVK
ncbi:MAG TPA: hypothetical protein VI306_17350 [Pyrinomonadaceae bacterium]